MIRRHPLATVLLAVALGILSATPLTGRAQAQASSGCPVSVSSAPDRSVIPLGSVNHRRGWKFFEVEVNNDALNSRLKFAPYTTSWVLIVQPPQGQERCGIVRIDMGVSPLRGDQNRRTSALLTVPADFVRAAQPNQQLIETGRTEWGNNGIRASLFAGTYRADIALLVSDFTWTMWTAYGEPSLTSTRTALLEEVISSFQPNQAEVNRRLQPRFAEANAAAGQAMSALGAVGDSISHQWSVLSAYPR